MIGAGAAGLCCARHLSRFPELFQFTVFEQSEQVGGVWVYHDPSPGQLPEDVRELTNYRRAVQTPYHSTMYKNLRQVYHGLLCRLFTSGGRQHDTPTLITY